MMTETTPEATNPDEYNGWTNRETWAASLHLSNDYGIYTMVNGWAIDAHAAAVEDAETDPMGWHASGIMSVDRLTVRNLETKLHDYIDDLRARIIAATDDASEMPSETETMMVLEIGSDWRVDWVEVATNWLDGLDFDDA